MSKRDRYLLTAPEGDMGRWRAEAEKEGLKLAEWIRRRLNDIPTTSRVVPQRMPIRPKQAKPDFKRGKK